MPVVQNLLSAVIGAPVVTLLAALSLSVFQRSLEWIASIAENPQKGTMRQLKPYFKQANMIIERLLAGAGSGEKGGSKFAVDSTTIMLTAVVICLLCLLFENAGAEKPKVVRVVSKKEDKEN